jgi:tetratricopeptide (TPR) repeat protein
LNNLGNSLRDARRDAEAEDAFGQARTINTQLVAEFPGIPDYRRGLAIVLNNLGILFKNTDRPEMAEELYRQTVTIHKQLAADFPQVSNHQNEAGAAMVNLARMHLIRKDAQAARRLLEEALPYTAAALKANPRDLSYRNNFRLNRWRMAEALLELKEHAAAAVAAEQFLQTQFEPPRDSYTAAGLLAGCAGLATKDDTLTDDKRHALATTYGDRAVAALRQAINKGAKEVTQMAEDPSLAPLRSRPDFQKLLAEWDAQKK